jgi:DNA-binding MarR family transcriptional regulator
VTLSPISRQVLTAICAEPGERTVRQLGAELNLQPDEVGRVVHQLSRRGLLAPRRFRLHPWAKVSASNTDLERKIIAALKKSPQKRPDLALLVNCNPNDGDFRRCLKRLHNYGSISLPAEVDPSAAGKALIEGPDTDA